MSVLSLNDEEVRRRLWPPSIVEMITWQNPFRKGQSDAAEGRFDPDNPGVKEDYYCCSSGYEMGWQYEKLKLRGDPRDFAEMLWSGDIR